MKKIQRIALGVLATAFVLGIAVGTSPSSASPLPQSSGSSSAKATAAVSQVTLIDGTAQSGWTTILSNTLKTANKKDLFVDVSLETGLLTQTKVSSKNGKQSTSTAEAECRVRVMVDGVEAYPGDVIFGRRMQELTATFQGLISKCFFVDPNGNVVLDENCVEPEELELVLSTMDAHSFNFIYPNCAPGLHSIEVQCMVSDSTTAAQPNYANAYATIGKGSCTVEENRMVQNEIVLQ